MLQNKNPAFQHDSPVSMNARSTILLVESNEDAATLFNIALRRAGIANPVQIVPNGEEAISYLCGEGRYADRLTHPLPKAIFTERRLPSLSGFELLKWLRNHSDYCVIPVIVLTADDLNEDVREAYSLGANAYLIKPPSLEFLHQMLKTAFDFWNLCAVPQFNKDICSTPARE